MTNTVAVDFPQEVLLELHLSREELVRILKETTALSLYRQGKLSSGLAAKWAGQARIPFLMKAMEQGARLLDRGEIDFICESSLG